MTNLEERRSRGFRAKSALDEFLAPAFEAVRAEYLSALMKTATNEPWETTKIRNLSIAQSAINEVERQIRAIVTDGEMAASQKSRAEKIAALPEHKRKWIDFMRSY